MSFAYSPIQLHSSPASASAFAMGRASDRAGCACWPILETSGINEVVNGMPIAGLGLRFESGSLGFADRLSTNGRATDGRTSSLQSLAERIEKQLESVSALDTKRDLFVSDGLFDGSTFNAANNEAKDSQNDLMSGPTSVAQFGLASYAGLDNS